MGNEHNPSNTSNEEHSSFIRQNNNEGLKLGYGLNKYPRRHYIEHNHVAVVHINQLVPRINSSYEEKDLFCRNL